MQQIIFYVLFRIIIVHKIGASHMLQIIIILITILQIQLCSSNVINDSIKEIRISESIIELESGVGIDSEKINFGLMLLLTNRINDFELSLDLGLKKYDNHLGFITGGSFNLFLTEYFYLGSELHLGNPLTSKELNFFVLNSGLFGFNFDITRIELKLTSNITFDYQTISLSIQYIL